MLEKIINTDLLHDNSCSSRKKLKNIQCRRDRDVRFENQIYGIVQNPIIPKNIIGFWEPPSYIDSRLIIKSNRKQLLELSNIVNLNLRCFYTGVSCQIHNEDKSGGNPIHIPWFGTKDHLVPARRDIRYYNPNKNLDTSQTIIWSSYIVNNIFKSTPMMIKLKVRQWLKTIPYDRNDVSVTAGLNMKWLIIKLLDEFRIDKRYPWSCKFNGSWFNPDISEPFMNRMLNFEREFLLLTDEEQNTWISNFNWQF